MVADKKNKDKEKRGHAIALFSGGLDSALAILLLLRQNIEVTALTFMTHFGCDLGDRSSCGSNPYPAAEKFGFNVKLMHLGQKFVNIVTNPKFGRGANMNPCVDCRLLMLEEAKNYMEMIGADFVVTGEVIGQRPFSQVKDKMNLVLKKSNMGGLLLRPLSAKLLNPTEPELSGLVDREKLEGISGRGRKRQIELAAKFGLEDYPNPGSGCLLTDESYSVRLRDLIQHTERISFDDLNMLRVGRHFRLDPQTKVIVGRDEKENSQLLSYRRDHHLSLEAPGIGSPLALLEGSHAEENVLRAAEIVVRYSSAKNDKLVPIQVMNSESSVIFKVSSARDEELANIRIG